MKKQAKIMPGETGLDRIINGKDIGRYDRVMLVLRMSIPAILAELTSIAMQYIDAGMVGSLGAEATAAIGLVSSTTWLVGGSTIGIAAGFYVQVAHLIGAKREKDAENVLRQGLKSAVICGLLIAGICASVSGRLPVWLGGSEEILSDAASYFFIYSLSIPFILIRQMSLGMMQSTGDMKTPSILSALICLLDVILNMLMIFPPRLIYIGGMGLMVPGAGLKVTGAAIATAMSEVIISIAALYLISIRNSKISLKKNAERRSSGLNNEAAAIDRECHIEVQGEAAGSWRFDRKVLRTAARIGIPLSFDQIFMCSAYIAGTFIVAKLGTVPTAANSLAITAESLCYMPGYGIGAAATAIIGQSIGAGRYDLTRSFARTSVYLGMILMGIMGIIMYASAPLVFGMLTSSSEAARLGTEVLRIELFAEPMYAASISAAGVFRGAGDTLTPSIMNLASMWIVRIVPAFFLVPVMGLRGYWIVMAAELCFRGVIFLVRMYRGKWMRANS